MGKKDIEISDKNTGCSNISIALIIPFLDKYGGAEHFLIECAVRWQDRHNITIYSTKINDRLLKEHGIGDGVARCELAPYFEGEHSLLLNSVLLPKIWRKEISHHDVYHTHLWPTHLVDLHPMVWYPHEPMRILHDLRYEQDYEVVGKAVARNVHLYPKYNYDRIGDHQGFTGSEFSILNGLKPFSEW